MIIFPSFQIAFAEEQKRLQAESESANEEEESGGEANEAEAWWERSPRNDLVCSYYCIIIVQYFLFLLRMFSVKCNKVATWKITYLVFLCFPRIRMSDFFIGEDNNTYKNNKKKRKEKNRKEKQLITERKYAKIDKKRKTDLNFHQSKHNTIPKATSGHDLPALNTSQTTGINLAIFSSQIPLTFYPKVSI